MRTFRILGKKGKITIPWELRQQIGFLPGDVISFETVSSCAVLVRREQLLNSDRILDAEKKPLKKFLDSLSPKEQFESMAHLHLLWAVRQQEGKERDGI